MTYWVVHHPNTYATVSGLRGDTGMYYARYRVCEKCERIMSMDSKWHLLRTPYTRADLAFSMRFAE